MDRTIYLSTASKRPTLTDRLRPRDPCSLEAMGTNYHIFEQCPGKQRKFSRIADLFPPRLAPSVLTGEGEYAGTRTTLDRGRTLFGGGTCSELNKVAFGTFIMTP
jgi:hypothetical protein